ncbi:MAG: hypothetical protein Tsb0034_22360 [Ekhidna sp.]
MYILTITLTLLFSQQSAVVVKNNGEEIKLTDITIFQKPNIPSKSAISYSFRGQKRTLDYSAIRRINLKESLGRKKGVTTWKALLVTRENEKFEIEVDIVEIGGKNEEGKEEVYSSHTINKISL